MTPSLAIQSGADPRLSANIYCATYLDRAVAEVVAPLWRQLAAQRQAGAVWLWMLRYGKGGEHLKLRLHDPGEILDLEEIKSQIAASSSKLFATLPALPEDVKSDVKSSVPPIDVEDRQKQPHEDRSLLFTTYKRHRLSLGDDEMFSEDRYCELMTRALAAGTGLLLAGTPAEEASEKSESTRLLEVFTGLAAALRSLDDDVEKRASYFAYHRDWLLRFSLTPSDPKVDPAEQSRQRFDRKLGAMDPERRRSLLERAWLFDLNEPEGPFVAWADAIRALAAHAGPIARALDRALDPWARDFFDTILFKLLQGFANASGLRVFDEAWVHHMLHTAMKHPPAAR